MEDGEKKISAMMEKSPLKRIWVEEREMEQETGQAISFILLKGRVERTEDLNIPLDETSNMKKFWELWTTNEISLKRLKLRYENSSFDEDLDDDCCRPFPTPPPTHLNLSSLTHLALENYNFHLRSSFLPLLQRLPNLQHLHLNYSSVDFSLPNASPSNPTVVHLPNLLSLNIHGHKNQPPVRNMNSFVFLAPKLQIFDQQSTETSFSTFVFPPSPHPPNISNLRVLNIAWTQISDQILFLDQLAQLRVLEELEIEIGYSTSTETSTLARLTWPGNDDGERDESGDQEGCCPLLRKLTISEHLPEYTSGALVRMVASRERGSREGTCRRIEELIVHGGRGWLATEFNSLERTKELLGEHVGRLVWIGDEWVA